MTDPLTRREYEMHVQHQTETNKRILLKAENHASRIDELERRMDRYLGPALIAPWVLSSILGILYIGERLF